MGWAWMKNTRKSNVSRREFTRNPNGPGGLTHPLLALERGLVDPQPLLAWWCVGKQIELN